MEFSDESSLTFCERRRRGEVIDGKRTEIEIRGYRENRRQFSELALRCIRLIYSEQRSRASNRADLAGTVACIQSERQSLEEESSEMKLSAVLDSLDSCLHFPDVPPCHFTGTRSESAGASLNCDRRRSEQNFKSEIL